ncbi:MAG: hypothetical protein CUN52_06825 [Phototrophicales bacterium]|nr:MAG: hypothetical protein CUN52_06825 [Phototrophicales bacterium]
MSKIIICYNPDDTKAASSRLSDYLVNRFGAGIVTLGVEPLISSAASADAVIQNADSLVVMIGKKWQELGSYHNPNDLNRVAINSALRLHKKILPVLVSGATIPDDLPADISAIAGFETFPFTAQTVNEDANRIAEALIQAAMGASTPPPNKTMIEQPTFMGPVPTSDQPPVQNPFGQPPIQNPFGQPPIQNPFGQPQQPPQYGMQPYGAYNAPKPPKPPVEPTSIPMIDDVTRFVRPLFERFGTLVMLLAPSGLLFGIWFFMTSVTAPRSFGDSAALQGIVSAVFLALALYAFFYLLSIAIPKLQLKTALVTVIGLPVLTFLFILVDSNFLFTAIYLIGCGGIVAFGYSQRNTVIRGVDEPRLETPAAITLSLDISGLVAAMWMLWTYSGARDIGNRNFAALVAGVFFGVAFAYVMYHGLKDAKPQAPPAYMPPPYNPPPQ